MRSARPCGRASTLTADWALSWTHCALSDLLSHPGSFQILSWLHVMSLPGSSWAGDIWKWWPQEYQGSTILSAHEGTLILKYTFGGIINGYKLWWGQFNINISLKSIHFLWPVSTHLEIYFMRTIRDTWTNRYSQLSSSSIEQQNRRNKLNGHWQEND